MANKLLTGIIVAVIVIAAVGAAVIMTGKDENKSEAYSSYDNFQLLIYGNADNSFTIDDNDLKIVQGLYDGSISGGLEKYPFADANKNGAIDAEDVEIVKKLVNRQSCDVYVACNDINGNATAVKVSYPIKNPSFMGMQIINAALYANAGDKCVAYYNPSGYYENAMSSLAGTNIGVGMGTGANWQTFMEVDSKTPVGAVFVDSSYSSFFTDSVIADFEAAEIPTLFYNASAYTLISFTVTIGFLCGEDTEKVGTSFASDSVSVLNSISSKTKNLSESKKTVILATMYIVIYGVNSSNYELVDIAGAERYGNTNSEFASMFPGSSVNPMAINKESLSNFQDAGAYVCIRTLDYGQDRSTLAVETFEYLYYNISTPLEFYDGVLDRVYFINNLLPAVVKAAYIAEALYPTELKGFGDESLQRFIDGGYSPFKGQTVDTVVGCITYADYLNAKKSA